MQFQICQSLWRLGIAIRAGLVDQFANHALTDIGEQQIAIALE